MDKGVKRFGVVVVSILAILAVALLSPLFAGRRPPEAIAIPFHGKVARTLVKPGQDVIAGEALVELDTSAYQNELEDIEAELKAMRSDPSVAMAAAPEPSISGTLPATLPEVETVRVPVAQPQTEATKNVTKAAPRSDASLKNAVASAQEELALLDAELAENQRIKADLEPKLAEASATAEQTAKKAASASELFNQGVISAKRLEQLQELSDDANENLQSMRVLLADVIAKGEAAEKRKKDAQSRLDSAMIALNDAPPRPKLPKLEPKKPVEYTTKIVTRRMPLVVKREEEPVGPMEVLVDEDALQANQQRTAEIQKRIGELHRLIDSARLSAPIAGRIERITSDAIWIQPSRG